PWPVRVQRSRDGAGFPPARRADTGNSAAGRALGLTMEFDFGKRILHWVAILVTGSVLVLICSGGLVTSHEAGMAVPDWPNSFGYNMFLFPVSRWVGGVLFEHTHRLIASGVGLLTILLCLVTLIFERRRWVKVLSGLAVLAVILQGVLG